MDSLNHLLVRYNIHIDDKQTCLLAAFDKIFRKTNEKMNLSAIRDPKEIKSKHFLDSLIIANYLNLAGTEKILDLGTGGGFPGVPIKVIYPDLEMYFLDSVRKKLDFVRTACEKMKFTGTNFLHMRAEDAGHNIELRASMDVIVARAVAYLPVLIEYAAPLLKEGGILAAAKLCQNKELDESENAMHELGMRLESQYTYYLPDNDVCRQIIILRKMTSTAKKYPRKAGLPKKTPL